jgi:hypothetical protein
VTWWEIVLGRIFVVTLGFVIWLMLIVFVVIIILNLWHWLFGKDEWR